MLFVKACLLASFITPFSAAADFGAFQPLDKLFLFGDSLTQKSANRTADNGFSLLGKLESQYARRLDVFNRGFGGYTSSNALQILPQQIPPPAQGRIRIMTIAFGTNDGVLPPGDQAVPLKTYKRNLNAILNSPAVQAHDSYLILVTPPPIDERREAVTFGKQTRTSARTAQYADAVRQVAQQNRKNEKILLLDLWTVMMSHVGYKPGQKRLPGSKALPPNKKLNSYLLDGVHLTSQGYEIYYNALVELLQKRAMDVQPQNIKMNERNR